MTIQATVTIRCDKGGEQFTYEPPSTYTVSGALLVCETLAVCAGWEMRRGQHLCPACVDLEKHPAKWTKEAAS